LIRIHVDRVAMLGVIFGLASFLLPFFRIKPSRLAGGSPSSWLESLPFSALGLLIVLWLMIGLLSLISKSHSMAAFGAGLGGNLIIILLFFWAGFQAQVVLPEEYTFGRVALGAGFWIMILGAYLVILSARKTWRGNNWRGLLLSWVGLVGIALLLVGGGLDGISVMEELSIRKNRFRQEFFNHLFISFSAVGIATAVGLPLGIFIYRKKIWEKPVFFLTNTMQTVPALALFGLLIGPLAFLSRRFPLLRELGIGGIGWFPAMLALILYALLPIIRNTYTSFQILDEKIVEAGKGMGMNSRQLLFQIQLPLALPLILTGIRTSLVQTIGNTTLAALIGAGGFGVFVFQGLGQAAHDLILLGVFPVIGLALIADKIMQQLVIRLTPKGIAVEEGGD